MGGRARSGSERLRTLWTPEMDRYFIDLMLEQVRKGNRIDDHLFSKRAWKHMTSLFNARFQFEYEKDVLKNRHKTLRNLYKAIKNLLQHKGFCWDETRQMVMGDNKVWDDYIKVHPDARSFRIKTIPYYNDLCEIYINTTNKGKDTCSSPNANTDRNLPESNPGSFVEDVGSPSTPLDDGAPDSSLVESSSHSGEKSMAVSTQPCSDSEALHEILIDEDFGDSVSKEFANYTPQTVSDAGPTMGTRTRTYWQPPMDRYFIDLMLDHVQKGNQIDGLFHKQAWMDMIVSFNTRFGFKYDVDILKNRYKTLRRQYNVIKNLLELDGFIWDDTREMVTADDCVWQDYIKAHTDARQYMTRPVPYYKDLCVICQELSVDARDSVDEVPEVKLISAFKGSSRSPATSVGDEQESSHRISMPDQNNKRQLETPSSSSQSKKTKTKDNEGMASALREMATAVSFLADKKKDEENENSFSIENVVEEIQALPDMDEDLVLDACDFLEDEKKAKTFLALDFKLRKKWLIRKLRPDQYLEFSRS